MPTSFQLLLGGELVDDELYGVMGEVQVEENADLPGAVQFTLPVTASEEGDLTYVGDRRFAPFADLAVVATVEGQSSECIFEGVVLSHKLHLEPGITSSTVQVWGQDASWRMNLEEKVHEWVDMTDAAVANAIFEDYGFRPAGENTEDDSPSHTEAGHTLMQRATDIQFLRNLARRNGKLCRVAGGSEAGDLVGYFAKPSLDGEPSITLRLNDPVECDVDAVDIEWDVMRPSTVQARQALFTDDDEDGAGVDTADSGLDLLDERGLADFAGETMSVLLTAPVDDAGELTLRAQSLLREAGWFVRCECEADVARLDTVPRVGQIVQLAGIGTIHSGNYLVWSVRHTITARSHKAKMVMVRNAVGPGGSGGGLLSGLI